MQDAVRTQSTRSPLWPAQLDHLARASDRPDALVAFYRDAMGMAPTALADGQWLLRGPQRRLLIASGARGGQPLNAFRVQSRDQLDALARLCIDARHRDPAECDAVVCRGIRGARPGFAPRRLRPARSAASTAGTIASGLPGRLQHVVVATDRLDRLIGFYERELGFVASDHVFEHGVGNGEATATFLRSDPEHHSFAAFRAPGVRGDHHSYETTSWNDIRDWADHMGRQNIKLWWGPGRHGPATTCSSWSRIPTATRSSCRPRSS